MYLIYLFFRIFPYLAIPVGLSLLQLGLFFRRRRVGNQRFFWISSGACFFLSLMWVILRGDLYSDLWIHWVLSIFKPL